MAKWKKIPTDDDVAPFSDDPVVKRHVRRHRVKLMILALLLLVGAGFTVKPAYRWFRNEQIERNLEEAKAAMRVEDWATARDKSRSVLIARRQDIQAYRIWFRALSRLNDPTTYLIAMGLFVNPDATKQDKVDALEVLSRQAPHSLAIAAFQSFDLKTKQETATRVAFAPLLFDRREFDLAEKMLREAPELESNAMARLELIRVLSVRPTETRLVEARKWFASLIKTESSAEALAALLVLSEVDGGLKVGSPLPDSLSDWVSEQPKAETIHHLVAMNPQIEFIGREAAEPFFERAISRFLELDPGILGSWLIRHGQSERVAKLLEGPAQSSPTAYMARANALLRLDRADELKALLANPLPNIDLVEYETVKAILFRALKDRTEEKRAWENAMANAAFDQSRNRFIEIARMATDHEAAEVAEDAWVAAVRVGWGRIPLTQDLNVVLASLAAKRREEDLVAMYRTLARFEPMNAEVLHNLSYLALAMGLSQPEEAIRVSEQLLERFPNAAIFRTTLALALLVDGQIDPALEQALRVLQAGGPPNHMMVAVTGVCWLAKNDGETAQTILAQVDWRQLSRSETTLIRGLLNRYDPKEINLPDDSASKEEIDPDSIPAWRKAVERLEKERAQDVLPALPMPKIPGQELQDSLENVENP